MKRNHKFVGYANEKLGVFAFICAARRGVDGYEFGGKRVQRPQKRRVPIAPQQGATP